MGHISKKQVEIEKIKMWKKTFENILLKKKLLLFIVVCIFTQVKAGKKVFKGVLLHNQNPNFIKFNAEVKIKELYFKKKKFSQL